MTTKEFAFLCNLQKEEALTILNNLQADNKVSKYEGKNGVIWKGLFKNV